MTATQGIDNLGTLRLESIDSSWNSNLTVSSGIRFNRSSGVIDVNLGNRGSRTIAAELDNQGTVNIVGATILAQADAAHLGGGTINLLGGNLTVNQSGANPSFSNTGDVDIDTDQVLILNGGEFTNAQGGTTKGNGTLGVSTTAFSNAGLATPVM